jgi:integrase
MRVRRSLGWVYARRSTDGQRHTWYIGYYAHGRRIREAAGPRKTDAIRLLQQRMHDLETGRWRHPTQEAKFEQLLDLVRADYRANGKRSLDRVNQCANHLAACFQGAAAQEITAADLARYVEERLDAGAATSTVRNELNVLKRGFTLAWQKGLVSSRPAFPTLRPTTVRTGFFERHELERLLPELPPWVQPVVVFLYHTGWRQGEALSRQWHHVDVSAGTIRLEPGETKNGRGRIFPFRELPELAGLLDAQRRYTDEVERDTGQIVPWVFHREGTPIRSFRTAWRAACRRAGLSKLVHDLRRTAARNMVRAGVPQHTVMRLCGWETDAMFRRYCIQDERDLRAGVEKLAQLGPDPQILSLPATNRPQIRLSGRKG